MVSSKLIKAQAMLDLKDIILNEVNTSVDRDEVIANAGASEVVLMTKELVAKADIIDVSDEISQGVRLFRVFAEFGVRLKSSEAATSTMAQIECNYIVEYILQGDQDEEALDEFVRSNSCYHVYPYFREYISDLTRRMRLPNVTLPMTTKYSNVESQSDSN